MPTQVRTLSPTFKMKIAFIGAHGTGKTILCHELAAWLKKNDKEVELVTEVARDAIKVGLPINESTTIEAQIWIILTQIAKEIEAEKNSKIVICDRSVIDNYAYLFHSFGSQKHIENLIKQHLKSYDFLFKVPIFYQLKEDGVRTIDENFQKVIDETIDKLLDKNKINHYKLLMDKDFLEQVKETINEENESLIL